MFEFVDPEIQVRILPLEVGNVQIKSDTFNRRHVFRWQKTACTLWKLAHWTLQALEEFSLRFRTKTGYIP